MIDATKLGQVTAELMQSLEEADVEQAELGEVMVLAEVKAKDEDGAFTYIAWRCSDDRQWVQRGLLHAGLDQDRETEDGEADGDDEA